MGEYQACMGSTKRRCALADGCSHSRMTKTVQFKPKPRVRCRAATPTCSSLEPEIPKNKYQNKTIPKQKRKLIRKLIANAISTHPQHTYTEHRRMTCAMQHQSAHIQSPHYTAHRHRTQYTIHNTQYTIHNKQITAPDGMRRCSTRKSYAVRRT